MKGFTRWLVPATVLAVAAGASTAFSHSRVQALPYVPFVQTSHVWTERQGRLWQDVTSYVDGALAYRQRIADAEKEAEEADIRAIAGGDHDAMVRQGQREDLLVRDIIARCDPALTGQLPTLDGMSWPLAGVTRITSPYGNRVHPIIGEEAFHHGVDLQARYGSPISAAAGGLVLYVGTRTAYGNLLVIVHGGGIATVYGHLWKFAVEPYQHVSAGDLVGYTGNTGFSTGPHLHFEVRQGGEPTDPLEWLPVVDVAPDGEEQ